MRTEADEYARALGMVEDFDKIMQKIKANFRGDYRNSPEYNVVGAHIWCG